MKHCKKCNAEFPNWAWVEGKLRNFHGRRYCFDCSPFGQHNTKQLEKSTKEQIKKCRDCGKEFCTKGQAICGACNYRKRRKARWSKIYSIVGTRCWHCGYDKGDLGRGVLEFHHVNTDDKFFNLSAQQYAMRRWELVFAEMKKCALLCCRCHREQQIGLIDNESIERVFQENWEHIMARGAVSSPIS